MVERIKFMGKRIRYKIGDIFLIELEDGLRGAGRIIKKDEDTIFVTLFKIKPLNSSNEINLSELLQKDIVGMTWCYDTALKKGIWEIVGNIPVEDSFEMPYFWTDSSDGKYYLIKGGDTYSGSSELIEVDKTAISGAYSYGISSEVGVVNYYIAELRKAGML